ncbi:mobilization protein MobC (plasmid) [Nostoc sp. HK-01]|nr:mobilization protein MobC [Nostoc sp. HK-01]
MVRTKPGQKIPIEKLQTTLSELDKLEEKNKDELSLRESVYFLREKLQAALKKGYSYQDLAEILEKQEISISAATLKQYLTEIEKEKSLKKRGNKSGKGKASASETGTVTESSAAQTTDGLTEESPQTEPEKEQSSVESTPPSGKSASRSKRQTQKPDKSNADIASEFNQY